MNFDEEALQTVRETRLLIDQYDTWLFDEFKPYLGKRVLEIGCGMGNQIRHLLDREVVVGIDPSGESISEIRRQFVGHPNLQAFSLSITDPKVLTLRDFEFDTALSLNVFEHIESDDLALTHTRSLLRPGGMLVLIVPAHEWLYGSMDTSIGHYRRYTTNMLKGKLERVGFRVIRQKYVNMVGAVGWLINGRILRRRVSPAGQLRVANVLTPFLRTIEGNMTPPFGISLLSIAEKSDSS